PGDRYENEACLERAEDGNTTGQFDPVGENSGEKEDDLNQVEFVLPQGLMLDAASSKVVKRSMKKGEERKKGPEKQKERKSSEVEQKPTYREESNCANKYQQK
ncbi:5014_t:CDS:2, partial [Cetraspora pellucida]